MSEIIVAQSNQNLPEEINKFLVEHDYNKNLLGKLYVFDSYSVKTFFYSTGYEDPDYHHYQNGTRDENSHKYDKLPTLGVESDDGENWSSTKIDARILNNRDKCYPIEIKSGETVNQAVKRFLDDVNKAFLDPSFLKDESEDINTDTAIVGSMPKDHFVALMETIDQRQMQIEAIGVIMKSKMNKLMSITSDLKDKLKKLHRIIDTIELYLGVREEIVQIREGQPAPENCKIVIHQLVLFWDEETGILHHNRGFEDGLDFECVDDFDNWLLEDNNLDHILPEQKGIVALRPSRHERDYSEDVFSNINMNDQNKFCYLLIRNGENLYRVWTSITIDDILFPTEKQSKKMAELFEEASNSNSHYQTEKAEEEKHFWLRKALLLQGILDRTQLFQPISVPHINLFNPDTFDTTVHMLHDSEYTLSDGHKSYNEWREEINASINRGSRIYFSGLPYDRDGHIDRHGGNFTNWCPSPPPPGVYEVQEFDPNIKRWWSSSKKQQGYKILYMPKNDEIWDQRNWEYRKRERRLSFWLYSRDTCVLNYDNISLEEVEFYINHRLERRNYLEMLPVLYRIKNARIKELKLEKDFVTLVANEMKCPESIVWEYVDWWKTKNIWKRPISQDDAKAWRMIKRKIAKYLENNHV